MSDPSLIDTWNRYARGYSPQLFMDLGRQHGRSTVQEVVHIWVVEATQEWTHAGLTAEDIASIRASLVAYLESTRGIEWR